MRHVGGGLDDEELAAGQGNGAIIDAVVMGASVIPKDVERVCLSHSWETNKQTNIRCVRLHFQPRIFDRFMFKNIFWTHRRRKGVSWHRFDPEMSRTNSLDVINVYVVTPLHNATTLHV